MAPRKVAPKRKLPVPSTSIDNSSSFKDDDDDNDPDLLGTISNEEDSSDSEGEYSQESDGELDKIEGEEDSDESEEDDDDDEGGDVEDSDEDDVEDDEDSDDDVESVDDGTDSKGDDPSDSEGEDGETNHVLELEKSKKIKNDRKETDLRSLKKPSNQHILKEKSSSRLGASPVLKLREDKNDQEDSSSTSLESGTRFSRDLWEDSRTEMSKLSLNSKDTKLIQSKEDPSRKRTVKSSWSVKVINDSQERGNAEKSQNTSVKVISDSSKEGSKLQATTDNSQNGTINEYEDGDTSDEEDIRNTIGNVPINWYDDYPHLGYDWDGTPIFKPKSQDALDLFLKRMEDPNFLRTVKDPQTGQDVVLSERDVELIKRIQSHKIPDADFDDTAPWIEYFSSQVMKTPLRNFPEHKRSFIPSKSEAAKVSKYVHALKMGWIKTLKEVAEEHRKKKEKNYYMLWGSDDHAVEEMRRIHNHLPAPKRLLPGHAESYNPPTEYLFDHRELKQWEALQENPWKRKLHFVPQKYNSLREVPAYSRYIRERFLRCLDLYMCPRARKMKLMIEPEDLLPKLPSPRDLQPFPTTLSMIYEGHTDMVRSITVDPRGQFLVSGSDDYSIKVWEISTGRCLRTIPVGGTVRNVSWCPNQALSLVAVAADRKLLLVNPGVGDSLVVAKTDSLLRELPEETNIIPERVKAAVQWEEVKDDEWSRGIRAVVNHFKEIRQVTWHGRGDYFASVMPEGANRSVIIHQLSKRRSQVPFSKSKGLVQCTLFHPIRPILFVATQRHIRAYDLVKQEQMKKLLTLSRWVSSMAFHPGGDNLIVGTYDRKVLWFDLDLSIRPYRTMRLHTKAVRSVAVHKRYPLFASASDDKSVIVCHGMVYNDLLKNALIVPLKRLEFHKENDFFGVFDVQFHPTQPWIFSAGADNTIHLCT